MPAPPEVKIDQRCSGSYGFGTHDLNNVPFSSKTFIVSFLTLATVPHFVQLTSNLLIEESLGIQPFGLEIVLVSFPVCVLFGKNVVRLVVPIGFHAAVSILSPRSEND